jgi:hypothetical protein
MPKFKPVKLMASSLTQHLNYLSLSSSRTRLADQYLSEMENIRLVEKLLLVKPTKSTSKSEHKLFYLQQTKYRKNLQKEK